MKARTRTRGGSIQSWHVRRRRGFRRGNTDPRRRGRYARRERHHLPRGNHHTRGPRFKDNLDHPAGRALARRHFRDERPARGRQQPHVRQQ